NVVSTEGTDIVAGHNIHTDAAEEYALSESSKEVKKSGLMGAGIGFMIGKQQSKDNYRTEETTHRATTLGSTNGKVTVQAGDTAHLTTTDIIADVGITLGAQDVILDGKDNTTTYEEVHEYKSSGLTVSLGGSVASAINTAYGLQQQAKGRQDKRLAALDYVDAGRELKTAAANIKDYTNYTSDNVLAGGLQKIRDGKVLQESARFDAYKATGIGSDALSESTKQQLKDSAKLKNATGRELTSQGQSEVADIKGDQKQFKETKRAKADSLANIKVSMGSSSSRSETSLVSKQYDGGSLTSNGLITVEAKSADVIKGNIKAIGETITGKEVKLIASNDVSLEAAENTSKKLENYKSKGWSVGANVSVNGGGILGLDASVKAAKQKGNTETTTHTAITITGDDSVHIESGHDTNIIGAKVRGNAVTADIGGNLHVESLQDTSKYIGENSSKGVSISTNGASLGNVSVENKKGTMKSDYASVTDQAGIYAGEGGFTINTKGNTSLKGAVIHSDADADKNTLSTGTLTTESIENTAEYTSRSTGIGYNHVGNFKSLSKEGKDAVWNTLGTLPTLQPDSKKSAYSTTNSAISNGTIQVREEAINLDAISRDTEHSLNKLDEIFDKKKIEERQELSGRFAKEAFGQLHNWNPTSTEGKAAKSIAHGVVAEISARIAGNKAGSGFYAGATNEALIGEINTIAKDRPDVAQWLSASLGAAVHAGMGKSPVTGAAVAQYGTKWNKDGVMPRYKAFVYEDYRGYTWKRDEWGRDTYLGESVGSVLEPGEVFVKQYKEAGMQAMGREFRYDGLGLASYIYGDGGIIEVGINEAYAHGFSPFDPHYNPTLPTSSATGTWGDYESVGPSVHDYEKLPVEDSILNKGVSKAKELDEKYNLQELAIAKASQKGTEIGLKKATSYTARNNITLAKENINKMKGIRDLLRGLKAYSYIGMVIFAGETVYESRPTNDKEYEEWLEFHTYDK
ncbi:hemagglutinin repeat-containing protein, partial [Veillonella caviae]